MTKPAHLFAYGYVYHVKEDKWTIKDQAVDFIYTGNIIPAFSLPGTLNVICNAQKWENQAQTFPLHKAEGFENSIHQSKSLNFIEVDALNLTIINRLSNTFQSENVVLFVHAKANNSIYGMRRFFIELMHHQIDVPVIMNYEYRQIDEEQFQLYSATDFLIVRFAGS